MIQKLLAQNVSRLLNEEKCWLTTTSLKRDRREILLKDGPQMLAIVNWYKNTKK
jgi:hypothetical protein